MSWLKAEAVLNVPCIDVTAEVSHALTFWLKAVAALKVRSRVVTAEMSHPPISLLKDDASKNVSYNVVTADVSQSAISPYMAVALAESEIQPFTAVCMLALVMLVSNARSMLRAGTGFKAKKTTQITKLLARVLFLCSFRHTKTQYRR